MTIKNMARLLRSGKTKRWHNNPDMNHSNETNAEHQWGVAAFVLWLVPDASRELIIAALHHDVGELVVGDLSLDFKRSNPTFAEQHAKIEAAERDKIVAPLNITQREVHILKIADWLAAWDAMAHHQPGMRNRRDWQGQAATILDTVNRLFGDDDAYNRVCVLLTERDAALRRIGR